MSNFLNDEMKQTILQKRIENRLKADLSNPERSMLQLEYLQNKEFYDKQEERERHRMRQTAMAKRAQHRRTEWMMQNKNNQLLADSKLYIVS